MNINGTPYRTIWLGNNGWSVAFIDQTRLPHELAILEIGTLAQAAHSIKSMQVRGAPLIGAMAALFLLHGHDDNIIPPAESVLLANHLRAKGSAPGCCSADLLRTPA